MLVISPMIHLINSLHGYVKCRNYVYFKSKYAEEKGEWRHMKYDNLKYIGKPHFRSYVFK